MNAFAEKLRDIADKAEIKAKASLAAFSSRMEEQSMNVREDFLDTITEIRDKLVSAR